MLSTELSSGPTLLRFPPHYVIDLSSGELLRKGEKVDELQDLPFRLLVLLVQRAGELVTRPELKNGLWPDDTFGGFEDGLNTAIRKIRIALSDSADNPTYIETIPRKGYRFKMRLAPPAAQRKMLAVLPFENLGGGPEEYLSDGIWGEMINILGTLAPQELGVIARSTMRKYRNTDKTIAEIGSELGVGYVLEGSVQRVGDRVRISASLVQVSDQTPLWAKPYDRLLTDPLAVQPEVATKIADSLAVELLPERRRPAVEPNSAAYDCYLRGRFFWNKRKEGDLKKAIEYFNRAINEQPGYAQAYAGLADCYAMLAWNTMLPPGASLPKARAAAEKALQLDERLAEAHTSLAFCRLFHDWDWQAAERGFQHAIELNPSYGVARPWYAFQLSAMGRHLEAVDEARRALRLDPFSLAIGASAALVFSLAGNHDEAVEQCLKTLEMNPTGFYQTHFVLGACYEVKGMFEEAVEALREAVKLSEGNPHMLAALGYALARSGRTEDASDIAQELKDRATQSYVPPYNIAMVYAGLARKDDAFEWMERAFEERSIWMIFLNVHPMFDDLRPDSRFKLLVERMKIPHPAA